VRRLWPDSRSSSRFAIHCRCCRHCTRRLITLGDETISDFADALGGGFLIARAGQRIPRGCADPRWLRYDLAARFSTYLERLFATVGRASAATSSSSTTT
jgi:hypothetical protein